MTVSSFSSLRIVVVYQIAIVFSFLLFSSGVFAVEEADGEGKVDEGGHGVLGDHAAVDAPEVRLEQYRQKYGDNLIYRIDDELKIIFAVHTDERHFEELRERLAKYIAYLQGTLFEHPIRTHVAIVVPDKWANPRVPGHYYPHFVDARTIGSNLLHEFTHALHFADQDGRGQLHRVWFIEGLASLYQESEIVGEKVVPRIDSALTMLKAAVDRGDHYPLKTLMSLERRQFTSRHYNQARYLCYYLHATGKLQDFYRDYTGSEDNTGIESIEAMYDKPLEEIEKDWVGWIQEIKMPAMAGRIGDASMGIWFDQIADGVGIKHFLPESGAEAVGMEVGDVIVRVGNRRIIDVEDLQLAIGGREIGDEVEVEFRRGGEYRKVGVALIPLPHPDSLPEELRVELSNS